MVNHPTGWPLLYETPLGMICLYGKVMQTAPPANPANSATAPGQIAAIRTHEMCKMMIVVVSTKEINLENS